MLTEIINALIPVIITALTGFISYLGVKIKNKFDEKINEESARATVQTVVKYIEQVFKDIHGKEKLDLAIAKAEQILEEKGLRISHGELEMMIEEIVHNINKEVKNSESDICINE